jgi:hypothetical protein
MPICPSLNTLLCNTYELSEKVAKVFGFYGELFIDSRTFLWGSTCMVMEEFHENHGRIS